MYHESCDKAFNNDANSYLDRAWALWESLHISVLYYYWARYMYWFFCEMHPDQTEREKERCSGCCFAPPLVRLPIKYEASCVEVWEIIGSRVVEELSSCYIFNMYHVTLCEALWWQYCIFFILSIKLYISKNMWHSAARCPSKPAYSPCFVLFFVSMYVGWHYIPFGIQSEAEWSKEKSREIVRWELAISRHCDEIHYLYVVEKKERL